MRNADYSNSQVCTNLLEFAHKDWSHCDDMSIAVFLHATKISCFLCPATTHDRSTYGFYGAIAGDAARSV